VSLTPFLPRLQIAARFMIEDDEEQMKEELKEAFRQHNSHIQPFSLTELNSNFV
jgi:hypothetical protein